MTLSEAVAHQSGMGVDATLALRNLAEASKQNMYEVKILADTMV